MSRKGIVLTENCVVCVVEDKEIYPHRLRTYNYIKNSYDVAKLVDIKNKEKYLYLLFKCNDDFFVVRRKYFSVKEIWFNDAIGEDFLLKFQKKHEMRHYNVQHLVVGLDV